MEKLLIKELNTKMPNQNIFLKLIKHDFDDESEAEAVEYSSVFGLALDYVNEGGLFSTSVDLEAIYKCYVPFYAVKINENNYISINAMEPEKNRISISKIPNKQEIRKILSEEDEGLGRVENLERELMSIQGTTVEVSGVLGREGKNGMVKLITQHRGEEKPSYKKIPPLVSIQDIRRQIKDIQDHAISEQQLETEVENLLDDIEKEFESDIKNKIDKKKEMKKGYDDKISEQNEALKTKLKEIEKEEEKEKTRIAQEAKKEKQDILSRVKSGKIWSRITNDLNELQQHLSSIKKGLDEISSDSDIDGVLNEIRILQDETQTFGTGLESAHRELNNRKHEFVDVDQQAAVDKRSISDKLNVIKEEEKRKIKDSEIERDLMVQKQENKTERSKQDLENFKKKRDMIKQDIIDNYQLVSNYTMKSEVLGVNNTEEFVTIQVPVAIGKYKEKKKLIYKVLIPFEIPPKMNKPKKLPITGDNGKIGFDCMAFEAKNFLKKNLEFLIEQNTNIQAEIQGSSNKMPKGQIDLMDKGLKVLEEKKGHENSNSNWLIGQYRTLK